MHRWILILLLCCSSIWAESKRSKICLNMIVKNESGAIEHCLESVKPWIDHWVIVDTGSTDGTQELIRKVMKGIPGELYERPWVNFGHNREEALQLAQGKGEYLLFIDADEQLVAEEGFQFPELSKDFYFAVVKESTTSYQRILLIKTALDWKWEGVVHEGIFSEKAATCETIQGLVNVSNTFAGARSKDPKKYLRDAELLERELEKDPHHARNLFYLAQSYFNAGEYSLALKTYQKRADCGPGADPEEQFFSLYMVGRLKEMQGAPLMELITAYTAAYQNRPTRAEPLCRLAHCFYKQGQAIVGYAVAQCAKEIPLPQDYLHLEGWIYEYGCAIALANCAFALGKYDEACAAFQQVLDRKELPQQVRKSVQEDLEIAKARIFSNTPGFEGVCGEYGNDRLALIARFLPEDPKIIEAGGHHGTETVKFVQKWPKATIYSFEPHPDSFQRLCAATRHFSNVRTIPYALADKEGKATLHTCLVNDGASSLLPSSNWMADYYQGPKVEVRCEVLDKWCERNQVHKVDFLWLDMEGMELPVLQSSPQILETVCAIYTETNFQEYRKGMTQYNALKSFLEKKGFALVAHWYMENFQGDALFVRRSLLSRP